MGGLTAYLGYLAAKVLVVLCILALGAAVMGVLWVSYKLNFPKSWWGK